MTLPVGRSNFSNSDVYAVDLSADTAYGDAACAVDVCGCCWCWCWVYRCWRCCTVVLGAMCSLPVAIDTVAMYSIVAMSCSVTDFIFFKYLSVEDYWIRTSDLQIVGKRCIH